MPFVTLSGPLFNNLRPYPPRRRPTCSRRTPRAKAGPDDFTDPLSDLHTAPDQRASLPPRQDLSVSSSPPLPAPSLSGDLTRRGAVTGEAEETGGEEVAVEEEEACTGDFLWSPALQEYREQREAGLISAALDGRRGEWSDAWALAVSVRKSHEMRNQYSRVGILMERNFTDFEAVPGCKERLRVATLQEIALVKAKAVYLATGLPAIAETNDLAIDPPESGSRINKTLQQGYYTRNVEEDADAMIDRVRPISDENRMTRFNSAVAFVDGEIEMITHKAVNVAIVFSSSKYSTIATSVALDDLYKSLTKRFALTLESPAGFKTGVETDEEGEKGKALVGATLLKERILRDGKMLNDSIIKVSSFLNHMVDVDLMEVCGEELAERLRHCMPNKLLTVESTGLIVGLPTARTLGIPLVFARKTRPITISDSYQTSYRSATKGTTNELLVSCEYLEAGDRVLIVDDFLAGGSTAEALFKLAKMAHAKVVGVGVLIEKMSDGGRTFLSGYDVPVESLAKILPGGDKGRINFVEEEPWVSPLIPTHERQGVREEALRASADYFTRAAASATAMAESAATAAAAAAQARRERGMGTEEGEKGEREREVRGMREVDVDMAVAVDVDVDVDVDDGSNEGVGIMTWAEEEEEEEEEDALDDIEESLIREGGRV